MSTRVPYRDRTQAPHNAAGLIFVPRGDKFRVWDNKRDNYLVDVWFNYAGVKDKWKWVGAPRLLRLDAQPEVRERADRQVPHVTSGHVS